MEAVVLEIYDRRGHVRFRQKLTSLPATIGRALGCDVIVDDPLVSGTHARLEEDEAGVLTLVDLKSRNGIVVGGKKVERVTLPVAGPVLFGGTRVGVLRASAPSEKTGVHRISRLDQPWLLVPALALATVVAYFDGWLDARELRPLKLISEDVLPLLIAIGVWALAWAVATRIAQGRFAFVGHLTLTAVTFAAVGSYETMFLPVVRFSAHVSWLNSAFLSDASLLIVASMLGLQLVRVTGWTRQRCMAIAYAFGLTWLTFAGVRRLVREADYDGNLYPPVTALPPAFVLGPGESVDAFLEGTVELQAAVDKLRVTP